MAKDKKPLISVPLPLLNQSSPPEIHSRQFNALIRNIVNTHNFYDLKYPELLRSGHDWYDRARDLAEEIGGGDHIKGAGIIAALSPQQPWEKNVADARRFAKTGVSGVQTGTQQRKALRILEGENPSDVLKGLKETAFYGNIANPDDPNIVTIDRHAHDIAVNTPMGDNKRGLSAKTRVELFQGSYRAAATHLGYDVPSRLQASVWGPWADPNRIRPGAAEMRDALGNVNTDAQGDNATEDGRTS